MSAHVSMTREAGLAIAVVVGRPITTKNDSKGTSDE